MDGSLIYRKTRRGAAELSITHGGHVATPSRRVLIVLDGRRTVDELTELFGAETVEQALGELEAQGLARLSDPEGDGQTTQQVAMLDGYNYPPQQPSEPDLALPETKPRRRGLIWIALALPALALAGGYWIVTNANRPADAPHSAAAAARPAGLTQTSAGPGPVAQDASESGEPSASPSEGPRELPLSGLPPVIITKASATFAAPAGAAPEAPAARRAPERPPVAQVEVAPAPSEAAPKTVAIADPPAKQEVPQNRPRETTPVVAPPAPAAATKADAGLAERVALRAPAGEPLAPESAAPAASPPVQVAAAAPTPLPATEAIITLHPRKRDPPQFPGRALRAKIDEGHVMARIWVTPEGKVEQVDIVKAVPPRIFDDEVRRALSAWTFDPPGQAVNRTVELTFKP